MHASNAYKNIAFFRVYLYQRLNLPGQLSGKWGEKWGETLQIVVTLF